MDTPSSSVPAPPPGTGAGDPPANGPAAPARTAKSRGRPAVLDPTRTVEAALELLDAGGLDALTMRSLAEALGVRAGALYRYFATKHDLLTAMAERMLDGVTTPPPSGADGRRVRAPDAESAPGGPEDSLDWSAPLADLSRSLRLALLCHRDGARVFAGTHSTGPNTLDFAEEALALLRGAGCPPEEAARALLALTNFTVGHTLEEQAALSAEDAESAHPADPDRLRQAVIETDRPHLTAALPTLADADQSAHFEFGLHLLLQGLRAHLRP